MEEEIERRVQREIKTLIMTHELELKNVQSVAMQEACNFVKNQCKELTKLLSKQHNDICEQFYHFRDRT